jgi:hypothetical protein
MSWQSQLKGDSLSWLLESDDPGVRYLALRDLVATAPARKDLAAAREAAHSGGPVAAVLKRMHREGYWVKPGAGYSPKYTSTVWSLILLAELGARLEEDPRLARACSYYLDQAFNPSGQVSFSGAPGSTADCLQGNMLWALVSLGCDDPRLPKAYEWMARTVTGEGLAPPTDRHAPLRYYSAKCGPLFACGANNKLPCAWGGAKVMMAFSVWPAKKRTPLIKRAIQQGADFFLDADPATANYPNGWSAKPSGNWWKFGFPVFYVTDILQIVEALVALGYARDPRLANALDLIRGKQDVNGRWPLEYDYAGKTWGKFGSKRQPNPWVTLRALRVLKAAG